MENNSIYSQIIESKNGLLIPQLKNGKTLESRYNPEIENKRIIENINTNSTFYILIGIAGGYLLNELEKKLNNKKHKIIGIEYSKEDLLFLKKLPLIKELDKNNNITLIHYNEIKEFLISNYLPALYGNLEIIELKSWGLENPQYSVKIKEQIKNSLKEIAADYSVQAHFGKIWTKNIINNIKFIDKIKNQNYTFNDFNKAFIIAAGPTLDNTINLIKKEKSPNIVISTDTAFSTLIKNEIIPNIVISIDAQNISHKHFLLNKEVDFSKILFIFDLSSNPSQIEYVKKRKGNIIFISTGHPLSQYYINESKDKIMNIFSGAGTVTIAALDFAIHIGFKEIIVLGADFSYKNAKAYAKGTYLDSIFLSENCKINNFEKKFNTLMFRSKTVRIKSDYYTEILDLYKKSFEDFIIQKKLEYQLQDNVYFIKNKANIKNEIKFEKTSYNFEDFIKNFLESKEIDKKNEKKCLYNKDICLLPLISWIRKHDNINESFENLLEKAYQIIERYFK